MRISKNMSTADRIVRTIVGVALVAALLAGALAAPWTYVAGVVAAIMLGTSAVGFCPLYAILGIRTAPATRS